METYVIDKSCRGEDVRKNQTRNKRSKKQHTRLSKPNLMKKDSMAATMFRMQTKSERKNMECVKI